MRILKRLTRGTKDAYWDVVLDCLVDLHQMPAQAARGLCVDRRASVEFVPRSLKSNVFYHKEPFEVASDLAARLPTAGPAAVPSLSDPRVKAVYEAILSRHGLA